MARSKNRKKKSKAPQQVKLKPENYIRKIGRKLPIHECLIDKNWKEEGFSPVIISRKRANGNMIACTYVVDLHCLGVKETMFIHDIDSYSYEENIKQMGKSMGVNFVKIDPILAFNIIYGAVEYAEDLGFSPHKDFTKTTEYLLDEVSTVEYMEIEFGKEGKPSFVAGPYDNSEQVLATLKKNVGEGNFDFIAAHGMDENFLDLDERAELGKYFPKQAMMDKEASLTGENLSLWDMQVTIALEALKAANGHIENIEPFWSDDDKSFFEDVFEAVLMEMESRKKKEDIEEGDTELIKFIEHYVIWVMEKLVEFKSTDFLFDPTYEPIFKELTFEELEKLDEETYKRYEQVAALYRTQEENDTLALRQLFLQIAGENFTEEEMLIKENQQKSIGLFLEKLKEIFKKDLTAQQIEHYIQMIQRPLEIISQSAETK